MTIHTLLQAIPILTAVALSAIAFTGPKEDGVVVCRARHNAEANTIVCHARRNDGYGVRASRLPVEVPHACAPGMSDQICQDAIDANKRALRRLP